MGSGNAEELNPITGLESAGDPKGLLVGIDLSLPLGQEPDFKDSDLQVVNFPQFDLDDVRERIGTFTGDPTSQVSANQSFLQQLGYGSIRTVAKTGLGLLELGGILGGALFEDIPNLIMGDAADFNNAFTQWARDQQEAVSEALPIYRRDPNSVFDIGDPAWWIIHGEGLVSSIGQFAAVGFGIGSVLGKTASILSKVVGGGARATTLTRSGAILGTAATLSYTEGAMSGAQVYQDVFTKAQLSGRNLQESREIAGEAAASTAIINTMINTMLNVTSIAPLFKSINTIRAAKRFNLTKTSSESVDDYLVRLKSLQKSNPDLQPRLSNTLKALGLEAGQESLEELVNVGAEAVGRFQGEEALGKKNATDSDIEEFFRSMFTEQGALSAIMGAVGGAGQKTLIDNVPFRGESTKNKRLREQQELFKQSTETVVNSIMDVRDAQRNLSIAADSGNQEMMKKAKDDLFSLNAQRHLFAGTEGTLIEMYEGIAKTDNSTIGEDGKTDAMRQGLTESTTDDSYKELARQAAEDVKTLAKDFNTLIAKHTDGTINDLGYAHYMFAAHVNGKSYERSVRDIIKQKQELLNNLKIAEREKNPTTTNPIEAALETSLEIKGITSAINALEFQLEQARQLRSTSSGRQQLLIQYGTTNINEISKILGKAAKDLRTKKGRLQKKLTTERKLFPEDTDISEILNEESFNRQEIIDANTYINMFSEMIKIADNSFQKAITKKGKRDFKRTNKSNIEREQKKIIRKTEKQKQKESVKQSREEETARKQQQDKKEQKESETKAEVIIDESIKTKQERAEGPDRKEVPFESFIQLRQLANVDNLTGVTLIDQNREQFNIQEDKGDLIIINGNELTIEQIIQLEINALLDNIEEVDAAPVDDTVVKIENALGKDDENENTFTKRQVDEQNNKVQDDVDLNSNNYVEVGNIKTTNGVSTMAYLSRPFITTKTGKKITSSNERESSSVVLIESSDGFKVGFQIDFFTNRILAGSTEFEQEKGIKESINRLVTHFEKDDSVTVETELQRLFTSKDSADKKIVDDYNNLLANLSINIREGATGDKAANLHLPSWITPENVAYPTVTGEDADPEIIADFYKGERNRLRAIKGTFIKEMISSFRSGEDIVDITTTVIDKSIGHLSRNIDTDKSNFEKGEIVYKKSPITNLTNVEFAISKGGILYIDSNNEVEGIANLNTEYPSGAMFAIIPTPTGDKVPLMLESPTLGEASRGEEIIDSIINSLRVHFKNESIDSDLKLRTKDDIENYLDNVIFVTIRGFNLKANYLQDLQFINLQKRWPIFSFEEGGFSFGFLDFNGETRFDLNEDNFDEVIKELRPILEDAVLNINIDNFSSDISFPIIKEVDGQLIVEPTSYQTLIKEQIQSDLLPIPGKDKNETIYYEHPTVTFDEAPFRKIGNIQKKKSVEEVPEKKQTEDEIKAKILAEIRAQFGSNDTDVTYNDNDFSELPSESDTLIITGLEDFIIEGLNASKQQETALTIANEIRFLIEDQLKGGLKIPYDVAYQTTFKKFETIRKMWKAVPGEEQIVSDLDVIISNWDKLVDGQVRVILQQFGYKQEGNIFGIVIDTPQDDDLSEEDEDSGTFDTEEIIIRDNWDDSKQFSRNIKDVASQRLKSFIGSISDVIWENKSERKMEDKENFLQMKKFMDQDDVWKELQRVLHQVDGVHAEDGIGLFIKTLKQEGINKDKAFLYRVAQRLEQQPQSLRNEFFSLFSNQKINGKTILFKKNALGYKIRVIDSDRNDLTRVIFTNWKSNFNESDLIDHSTQGEPSINYDKTESLIDRYTKLKANYTHSAFSNLLNEIGIKIPESTLIQLDLDKSTLKSILNTGSIKQYAISTSVAQIFTVLNGGTIKVKGDNPTGEFAEAYIYDHRITSEAIRQLAEAESLYNTDINVPNSYLRGDNKIIYNYQYPTYLSSLVDQLKEGNQDFYNKLGESAFTSTSYWLNELKTNSNFRKIFELQFPEVLKNENKRKGRSIGEFTNRELEIFRLGQFTNNGVRADNKGNYISKFLYPTPADKKNVPAIQAIRRNFLYATDINQDGDLIIKSKFNKGDTDIFMGLIQSEILRITYVKRTKEGKDNTGLYRQWDDGKVAGEHFFLFPILNNNQKLLDSINESIDNTEGSIIDRDILNEAFLAVRESLNIEVSNTIELWNKTGIIENGQLQFLDNTYKAELERRVDGMKDISLKSIRDQAIVKAVAHDLVYNTAIAYANMYQLIIGDPAMHSKSDINTTLIEVTKRTTKDIAPGKNGNFSHVGQEYKVIFINDNIISSDNIEQYRDLIGDLADPYDSIQETDAQEWTTLSEHINVLNAYGLLTDEQYDNLIKKAENSDTLSEQELDQILGDNVLQPMKPVQVIQKAEESGVNQIYYLKTSSFPLIPQLTKGLEIDQLRIAMERDGIQRAVAVTGAKLGATNTLTVFAEDVVAPSSSMDFENNHTVLYRSGFRIQEDVPHDPTKTEITEVSQAIKLLFEGIDDDAIKKRYMDLHVELMQQKFDTLTNRLNITTDEKGVLTIDDVEGLKDLLLEEAINRDYPLNDILNLAITRDSEGKASFVMPLEFTLSAERIEALISSVIKNVIKHKIPGNSYIQGSAAGFKAVENYNELSISQQNNIVYVEGYDPTNRLKFISKENKFAEILLPWNFTDNDGNAMSIKDFMLPSGELNMDRIDSELLEVIGMRIPNQGHNSMLPLKVVGFLPRSSGDLSIVPSEIVVQMGSDFDVDKLYIYKYAHEVFNFKLVRTRQENDDKRSPDIIKNEIIDIHKDILTRESTLSKIISPLTSVPLANIANEIDEILSADIDRSLLFLTFQHDVFQANKSGKDGIAFWSLTSTFNAVKQGKDIGLKGFDGKPKSIKFNVGGKVISASDLNAKTVHGNPNKTTQEVISYIQSASVDNAKEQILSKINLNTQTFPIAAVMALAGFDERIIAVFLSQEIIRDYASEMNSLFDPTRPFEPDKKKIITDNIIKKYTNRADPNFVVNSDDTHTENHMLHMIEDSTKNEKSSTYWGHQLNIFAKMQEIEFISKDLQKIQKVLNSDMQGIGKSLITSKHKEQSLNELDELIFIDNAMSLIGGVTIQDGHIVDMAPTTLQGHAFKFSVFNANRMFRNIFNYNSPAINDVMKNLSMVGIAVEREDDMRDVIRELRAYTYANAEIKIFQDETLEDMRNRLFYGDNNIANRLTTYKREVSGSNLFLNKIDSIVGTNSSESIVLRYRGSFAKNTNEELENLISINDLLKGEDGDQGRELMLDLIRYAMTTGAQNASISFLKYLPLTELNDVGITDVMDIVRNSMNNVEGFSPFVEQYIQHNPTSTEELNINRLSDPKLLYKDTIKIEFSEDSDNLYYYTTDATNGKTYLYKSTGQKEKIKAQEYITYEKISLLGNLTNRSGIKEYQYNINNAVSTIKDNRPISRNIVQSPKNLQGDDTNFPLKNENIINSSFNQLGLLPGKQTLDEALEDVIRASNVFYDAADNQYLALAKLYRKSSKGISVIVTDLSEAGEVFKGKDIVAGLFRKSNKTIYLNTNNPNNNSPQEIIRVLLHEATHALTNGAIEKFYNNSTDLSSTARKAISGLNDLLDQTRKAVLDGDVEGYTQEELEEFEKTGVNRDKYYGISRAGKNKVQATKEFIAEAMSSEQFQKLLSEVKVDGKSQWQRFIEFIQTIIQDVLGSNFKRNSIAPSTINNIISLIVEDQTQVNPSSEYSTDTPTSVQNDNRKEIIRNSLTDAGIWFPKTGVIKSNKLLEAEEVVFDLQQEFPGALRIEENKIIIKDNTEDFSELVADYKKENFEKEFTSNSKVDEMLARQYTLVDILERSKAGKDQVAQLKINKRIKTIKDAISEVVTQTNAHTIRALADIELNYVSDALSNDEIPLGAIRNMSSILSTWDGIKDILFPEGARKATGPMIDTTNYIQQRVSELNDSFLEVAREAILRTINKRSGVDVNMEELFGGVKDISVFRANFTDASTSSALIVRKLDKILNDSAFDTNQEFILYENELNEALSELEKHPEFKKSKYDMFWQVDNNDNKTGFMVHQFSSKYYTDQNEMKFKGWGNYKEWVRNNNLIVDYDTFLNGTDKQKFAMMKSITDEYGDERVEMLLIEAKAAYEQFQEDKLVFEETLESDVELTEDDKIQLRKEWDMQNNPKWIRQAVFGRKPEGFDDNNAGWKYIVFRPKRKGKDGSDTGYYDEQYDTIQNDPVLKKFYDFYQSWYTSALMELPQSRSHDKNKIPAVKRSLFEVYQEDGMKSTLVDIQRKIVESVIVDEADLQTLQAIDPTTQRPIQKIPTPFVGGSIPIEEQSKDLSKVLSSFVYVAMNFKNKNAVEDIALISRRLLQEIKEVDEDPNGRSILDIYQKQIKQAGKLRNVTDQLDYLIDSMVYGKRKKLQGVKKLQNKYIAASKIGDTLIQYTQLKGMGFNVFSSVTNLIFGWTSNFIHSSGGVDFTTSELFKASKLVFNSTIKSATFGLVNPGEADKIASLMRTLDVLFEVNESAYGNDSILNNRSKNGKQKITAYELQKRSEYFVQAQTMIASMLHQKIKDKDGNEKNLWEAFDKEGNFDTETFGEDNIWNGKTHIIENKEVNKFRDFRTKLIQVNKIIHGNYDPNSPVRIKSGIAGRFLMQFRSWMAEGWMNRMGDEFKDERLGRTRKGRWKSYSEVVGEFGAWGSIRESLRWFARDPQAFDRLTPLDKENMRRNMMEIVFALGFAAFGLMLKAISVDVDDEDDEIKSAYNLLFNQLIRLENDMYFYADPASFSAITKNAVPAFKTITDIYDILPAAMSFINGEDEYKTGYRKGHSRLVKETLDMIPLGNQYFRFQSGASQVYGRQGS